MKADGLPDGYVTVDEAAQLLGVSPSTVLNDVKQERLEGLDRGVERRPRWMASRSAVDHLKSAGGRADRRSQLAQAAQQTQASEPTPPPSEDEIQLRLRLDEALAEVARLSAENDQLRVIARNANMSVLAQTESVQQLLVTQDVISRS